MFFHGEDNVATTCLRTSTRRPVRSRSTSSPPSRSTRPATPSSSRGHVRRRGHRRLDAASLATTQPELSWGFKKVFGRLDRMADELRSDRSKPKLAAAVTLYT